MAEGEGALRHPLGAILELGPGICDRLMLRDVVRSPG